MPGQQAVARKLINGRLGQSRGVQVELLFDQSQLLDQRTGAHYPSHPQARKSYLREAAYMDYDPVFIQGLERRDRRAVISELAVDVIFDYRDAVLDRQIDKLAAIGKAGRHAGRILEGRYRIKQFGSMSRKRLLDHIEIDAFIAHGNWHESLTSSTKDTEGAGIGRVLYGDGVPWLDERALQQAQRLLAPVRNQDFVR